MTINKMLIAGVDEVGRGPLAGPVYAAAVILDPQRPIAGLADSKAISAKKREALVEVICQRALAFSVAQASVEEIERINILHASLLAMQRAVQGLVIQPQLALIDGNRCPDLPCEAKAIIQGDKTIAAISAASILAKVARDRLMVELDSEYPGYGFAAHKGYGTKLHMAMLKEKGPCAIHRETFAPVRQSLLSAS